MSLAAYVHQQFSGFLKAGKKLQAPKDPFDKTLSRAFGFGLLVAALGLSYFVWLYGYLSWRIWLRYAIIILPMLGFTWKFFKGISIRWMMKGLMKYWMPVGLLIWIYYVVFSLAIAVFLDTHLDNMEFGVKGGLMMCSMSFLAGLAYFHEGKLSRQKANKEPEKKTTHLARATASYFMTLMWIAFFVGGIVMLLWATGIGDAIFN